MSDAFVQFETRLSSLKDEAFQGNMEKFVQKEFLRFFPIAKLILDNFKDVKNFLDNRNLTHPLIRSLIEGWVLVMYLYWENDENIRQNRFDKIMDGFKKDYYKLLNNDSLPYRDELPAIPADADWRNLPSIDVNSMLVALRNNLGDKMDYLYFTYRVTSFDTHAKASLPLFAEAFQNENCSFIYIEPERIIHYISDFYIEVINNNFSGLES